MILTMAINPRSTKNGRNVVAYGTVARTIKIAKMAAAAVSKYILLMVLARRNLVCDVAPRAPRVASAATLKMVVNKSWPIMNPIK
jgi:hypothetical protein